MEEINIVNVTPENIDEYGVGCVKNKKHFGYTTKVNWYKSEYKNGLKIKLLNEGKNTIGFVEYTDGKFAWRPVDAKGYLFIHCIWVYKKDKQNQGFGSRLLKEVIEEAKKTGKNGVAAILSDGSWLANNKLFLDNEFEVIEQSGRYDLAVYYLKKSDSPKFRNFSAPTDDGNLLLTYADQCPFISSSVIELEKKAKSLKTDFSTRKLISAKEAQNAETGYGVYSLSYKGDIYADHYLSPTRFGNIINKELGKKKKFNI